jgi:hypothetical protein
MMKGGVNSFVGYILLDQNDTVVFDLGWYSGTLNEELKYTVRKGEVFLKNEKTSTRERIFYDYYGKADTIDLEKFHVNRFYYAKIDNRRAKIVQPKKSGHGITGIAIDSLWVSGDDVDRFQMSGVDLDSANERKLLEAFGTLKFRKEKE